jgi:outer membrane protein TolC
MIGSRSAWRHWRARLVAGFALPGLLAVGADWAAPASEKLPVPAAPAVPALLAPAAPEVQVLDLTACKAMALARQPAVAAARASFDAAVARQHALLALKVPTFIVRDLPTRREQAAVGVSIAQAEVQRAELDALYAVTFSYLSAKYAVEQRMLLDDTLKRLKGLSEGVKTGLESEKTNIRAEDLPRVDAYTLLAQSRREEAVLGEQRALSALREALGADAVCPLLIVGGGQFRVRPSVCKEVVVAEALARRPEIAQASLLTQIHGLEVDAQHLARRLFPVVSTFADGGDLHSRPLPAGSYGENYSPAAVGPEMPANLTGKRHDRVEIARIYSDRSASVLDKTRNLIRLETEQAYLRYVEASLRLPQLEQATKKAQEVFEATDKAFTKGERSITAKDWLSAGSLVTELRSEVNRARYQLLVSLARLERATAGCFRAGFETAPTSDPPEVKATEKEKKVEDDGKKADKGK